MDCIEAPRELSDSPPLLGLPALTSSQLVRRKQTGLLQLRKWGLSEYQAYIPIVWPGLWSIQLIRLSSSLHCFKHMLPQPMFRTSNLEGEHIEGRTMLAFGGALSHTLDNNPLLHYICCTTFVGSQMFCIGSYSHMAVAQQQSLGWHTITSLKLYCSSVAFISLILEPGSWVA